MFGCIWVHKNINNNYSECVGKRIVEDRQVKELPSEHESYEKTHKISYRPENPKLNIQIISAYTYTDTQAKYVSNMACKIEAIVEVQKQLC